MISSKEYIEFAENLYDSCIFTDAWIDGQERFTLEPVILKKTQYDSFVKAAEEIGFLYEEFCNIVWDKQELLDYFYLSPYQKLLWLSSGGLWHGISRLDLFILTDGSVKMCEMNSDTPSGEAETVLLNELFENKYPLYDNPNKSFPARFVNMIDLYKQSVKKDKEKYTVGIVYPTEMTEDLSMITIYEQWLADAGYDVVTGSPFNLTKKDKKLFLFGKEVDILFRHYKTDWWTERESVWTDFEYPDSLPMEHEINAVLSTYGYENLTIVNPFGTVLTQNKFSMSFFYDYFDLFSQASQKIIRQYVPETRRLIDLPFDKLNKDEWVLKSDYGCEGDGVLIGKNLTQEKWDESLDKMVIDHWIAQKYFEIAKYKDIYYPNYGVYLITGKTAGIYTRLAEKSTDVKSITAPTFIEKNFIN